MTIPAGNNWCPTCEEACHDHGTVCTVCGDVLAAPPPRPQEPRVALVPEHLLTDIRQASQEIRNILSGMHNRIQQVESEQRQLLQSIRTIQDGITMPVAMPPPPSGSRSFPMRTSRSFMATLPRILVNEDTFQKYTLQVDDHEFELIPARFGAKPTALESQVVVGREKLALLTEATKECIKSAQDNYILVLPRGGVTFLQKALLAEQYGAKACIIVNSVEKPWPYHMTDSTGQGESLTIPTLMMSKADGHTLGSSCSCRQSKLDIQRSTDEKACIICTEEFKCGETLLKLPCGHLFHEGCASQWLQAHNTCPYCRDSLPLEDEEQEYERLRQQSERQQQGNSSVDFYG